MDAASAFKTINDVLNEIDKAQQSRLSSLLEKARPVGLGLMLSLGSMGGCSSSSDHFNRIPHPDAGYGLPDSIHQVDAGHQDTTVPPQKDATHLSSDCCFDMITHADAGYGLPPDKGTSDK